MMDQAPHRGPVRRFLRSALPPEERLPGLKELKMSLDGVRKYYAVQRRLVEQRLLALEAGREGTETGALADDGSGGPERRSVAFQSRSPSVPQEPDVDRCDAPARRVAAGID